MYINPLTKWYIWNLKYGAWIANIAAKYDKIIWDQQVSCEIRDSHGGDYKNIVFCKVLRSSEMSVNQKISHLLFLHDPTNFVIVFWIFHHFSYSKNLFTHIYIYRVFLKNTAPLFDQVLRRKCLCKHTSSDTLISSMPHFKGAPRGCTGHTYIVRSPPKTPPCSCLWRWCCLICNAWWQCHYASQIIVLC